MVNPALGSWKGPSMRLFTLLVAAILGCGIVAAVTAAQPATPAPAAGIAGAETLILVERNDTSTNIQLGAAGPSAGDIRVWGPNPLFDAANATDTGATTQGSCIALDASLRCVLAETIVFADGSTLLLQGVEQPGAAPSLRTIVGGSGEYLGAVGIATVVPSDAFAFWTRTFEIVKR